MSQLPVFGHSPRPRLRVRRWWRELRETALLIFAIYALVNLVSVRFVVSGKSMEPTFHTGDIILVSRAHYMFDNPHRGDIAVFNAPDEPPDHEPYIKRVIGLPGETVEVRDQQVFINGTLMEEPYINEFCQTSNCPDGRWTLAADEYFLMGDNRNHSLDSRRFSTPVTRERIIGEALVRYCPPSAWGSVVRIDYPEGVNPP